MQSLRTCTIFAFWFSATLVAYAYFAYPVLIWVLSLLFGRKRDVPSLSDAQLPMVTLLVAAYNEEAVIGARIENALAVDYPLDRLEILIASDGSSDGTVKIAQKFLDRGVRLLDYLQRRGKAATLNAAIQEAGGRIVLFSDANTFTDPGAARALVRWFQYPEVGVVCGRLILTDAADGRNVDGVYWQYETFLKKCEGKLGALLGSNGAIYAMRKELYAPIPPDTIVDDFVIPLLAKQRTGCEIVYDCEGIAREETAPDITAEHRRRTRIGAGGFQAIGMLWRLLNPKRGWVAFTFVSHKILRWLCPFFLIVCLAANFALVNRPFYFAVFAMQVSFYVASALGGRLAGRSKILKPLRVAAIFTSMNMALLVGFFRWLRGGQKSAWERTARKAEAERRTAVLDSAGDSIRG